MPDQEVTYAIIRERGTRGDILACRDVTPVPPKGYEMKIGTARHVLRLNFGSYRPYCEIYDETTDSLVRTHPFLIQTVCGTSVNCESARYEDVLAAAEHPFLQMADIDDLRQRGLDAIRQSLAAFREYGLTEDEIGRSYFYPHRSITIVGIIDGERCSWDGAVSSTMTLMTIGEYEMWGRGRKPRPPGAEEKWHRTCEAIDHVVAALTAAGWMGVRMEKIGEGWRKGSHRYGVHADVAQVYDANPDHVSS